MKKMRRFIQGKKICRLIRGWRNYFIVTLLITDKILKNLDIVIMAMTMMTITIINFIHDKISVKILLMTDNFCIICNDSNDNDIHIILIYDNSILIYNNVIVVNYQLLIYYSVDQNGIYDSINNDINR